MSLPSKLIINSQSIIEKFGFWPEFHDFKITNIEMDSSGSLTLQIYGFNVLKETDEKGYFKLKNESVITLRFNDVSNLVLEDFDQRPNILFSLKFEDVGNVLKTTLDVSYGFCGHIVSKNAEVIKIEDYKAKQM